MKPGDARARVRSWFDEHGGAVRFALARYGVPAVSRPDLVQEVFFTAYLALLRDEPIERPRGWLRGVARGHASNFRRRAEHTGQVLVDPSDLVRTVEPAPSPAKQAEDRERLQLIFEGIEPEAQDILLDVHVEGMSFEDIASERGISVHSARYLYLKAVKQAEDAVKSLDSKKRGWVVLPLAFTRLLDSVRAEAEMSPDTQRRIWDSLERRIDAEKVGGQSPPEMDHASARPPSSSPFSIRPTNSPVAWHGPALIALVGGLLIGGVCGWLLHMPKSAEAAPYDPRRSVPALARAESSALPLESPSTASASTDSDPVVAAPSARIPPRDLAPLSDEQRLLDRALAGIATANALSALEALTEHARRFPASHAAARRRILTRVCDLPAARGAGQCSGTASGSTLP